MHIDKEKHLKQLWYVDKDGVECEPDSSEDRYQVTRFPLELVTKYFRMIGKWPDNLSTRLVFEKKAFMTNLDDLILAMANSGDYTLSEAIIIASITCGNCGKTLYEKYLGVTREYYEAPIECVFCTDSQEEQ